MQANQLPKNKETRYLLGRLLTVATGVATATTASASAPAAPTPARGLFGAFADQFLLLPDVCPPRCASANKPELTDTLSVHVDTHTREREAGTLHLPVKRGSCHGRLQRYLKGNGQPRDGDGGSRPSSRQWHRHTAIEGRGGRYA
jgi:hypothetical protein